MDQIKIEFDVNTTDVQAPLSVELLLDGVAFYTNSHVKDLCHVEYNLDDDDSQHNLQIVISGKTFDHTKIDENNNIIKDATLEISAVTVDGINIDQLFFDKSVYTHNFNGTQPEILDQFFGTAGCNGTISFEFFTPFYLWLLEHS